jgi:hypothetical protein
VSRLAIEAFERSVIRRDAEVAVVPAERLGEGLLLHPERVVLVDATPLPDSA